jgi:pyrroline-5-carboxylate reductase
MSTSIAFIGGGNMATAMVKGLAGLRPAPRITVSEPDPAKHGALQTLGAFTTSDNAAAVAGAQVVVLAIKPQMAATVVPGLAAGWSADKVLVSILAGTPTAKLEALLPAGAHVVRAMPNTPLAIGQGMVGLCRGRHASEADLTAAEALFAPCGKVLRVADESRMDAITAVSGSGPAYVFRFAEALLAGAKALGFNDDEAALLVGQTMAGSTAYLLAQGVNQAGKLREQVTSPGGTTAAALKVVDTANFTDLWTHALAAAEARGKELGKG